MITTGKSVFGEGITCLKNDATFFYLTRLNYQTEVLFSLVFKGIIIFNIGNYTFSTGPASRIIHILYSRHPKEKTFC